MTEMEYEMIKKTVVSIAEKRPEVELAAQNVVRLVNLQQDPKTYKHCKNHELVIVLESLRDKLRSLGPDIDTDGDIACVQNAILALN